MIPLRECHINRTRCRSTLFSLLAALPSIGAYGILHS